MSKKSERRKSHPFIYLGFFVICWWLLPASVKIFTQTAFREFQAPIWDLASRLDDLTNYWGHLSDSKRTLITKGKEFKRLTSDLELQKIRSKEIVTEINRLQNLHQSISTLNKLLNINSSQNFESVIARVSVRKMSGWWQQMTIRKGYNNRLQIGNGVIYNKGVIGRLINVDSRSAEIEIITNPNFRIVAHFGNDTRPVTFQGNGIDLGGQPNGIVLDVPYDIIPKKGEPLQLITSSLGGNFPHGMPIGNVYKLEGAEDGLFKTGKVIIDRSINEVLEVTLLIPE